MNRRGFLSSMLRLAVAPMVLPGAGRLWVVRHSFPFAPDPYPLRYSTFAISPWSRILTRSVFPEGMGETIRPLIYERSAPALVEPTWSPIDA
jgi:hypothetical protein